MVQENPIKEAHRYLTNAKSLLRMEAKKKNGFYQDPKYVRMAGNCAWNGVLIALDATLEVRKKLGEKNRPHFSNYLDIAAKADRKIILPLQTSYLGLHQSMGYDGLQDYKAIESYIKNAETVLNWCEARYKAA